jgi:alanine dehydrogenase
MIIGVPKEIKPDEYRVGVVPSGVKQFVSAGHEVIIEKHCGEGSGFPDSSYSAEGAEIVDTAEEVWKRADMVVKVKEPVNGEFGYMREGLIVYTYLHLAADGELTEKLLKAGILGIAYETVEAPDGSLPLLIPMSEIAGRMAVHEGAKYLEREKGGRGILLGGVPGVEPGKVVIIGGGVVGTNAAKMAVGLGARVTVVNSSLSRLRYLDDIFGNRIETLQSNPHNINEKVVDADLLIGAVLIPGAKTPRLVTKSMISRMKKGAVIVDVSVDQGGCVETSRPTSHHDPIYTVDGVTHYCVSNMPGAVPRTSTLALTNATFPLAFEIARKGAKKALAENAGLAKGVNVQEGRLTCEQVAKSLSMEFSPLKI